mmetsp:Transcript_2811/g.5394  ORF Transcript_2811/g.5394 Transcript_2811/m.5394 type:complete len:209 (-) Transcript_2811:1785-2411(-)
MNNSSNITRTNPIRSPTPRHKYYRFLTSLRVKNPTSSSSLSSLLAARASSSMPSSSAVFFLALPPTRPPGRTSATLTPATAAHFLKMGVLAHFSHALRMPFMARATPPAMTKFQKKTVLNMMMHWTLMPWVSISPANLQPVGPPGLVGSRCNVHLGAMYIWVAKFAVSGVFSQLSGSVRAKLKPMCSHLCPSSPSSYLGLVATTCLKG